MKIKHYSLIEPNLPSTDERVGSGGWWADNLKPAVRKVLRQALATIQIKGLPDTTMPATNKIPSNNALSAMDVASLDNHWDGNLDPFWDGH